MKINRRTLLAATAIAALTPSLALSQTPSSDLYEAARQEGELTWYIVHISSETAERISQAFSEKYPGVTVNVVRTTAQVAYQRLNQDIQAGISNCDVFASTDLSHYVDLKQRGLLMPYEPANASEIDERFRNIDPDNHYVVTSATFISIIYNTDILNADEAPKSWAELTDSDWKDKLAVGHPGFSGFVGAWVVEMQNQFGWEYFEQIAANNPQVGRSIIDTITSVASGERQIGAGPGALAQYQALRGNPIGVIYPEEGVVLMTSPSAIMADAPHPNAAKLFVEFLWGPEVAEISASELATPLRLDTPVREGVVPLSEMKTIRPSLEDLMQDLPEAIENWRDTFGI